MYSGQEVDKIAYELCYLDSIQANIFGHIGNISIDLPEIVQLLMQKEDFLLGDLKAHQAMLYSTFDRFYPDVKAIIRNFTHTWYNIEYSDLREQRQSYILEEVQYLKLMDDCTEEDLKLLDSGGEIVTSDDK